MYQRINMYATPAETAAEAFAIEYSTVMSGNVWLEDFSTLEACQAVAESGSIKQIYFQDQEVLCRRLRSEEHTSELQSLMRISYAVFCLTNKTQPITKCMHIEHTSIYHNITDQYRA